MNLSPLLQEITTQQYNLFVDLDEVITDFKSRYQHFTGLTPDEMDTQLIQQYGEKKAKSMFWDKVNGAGTKFWEEMEFMPDAKQLLAFLKPYEYKFLSSPSHSATSKEGKVNWAKKHFPKIELILRQAEQKQEFAGPKNILIDDKPSNIEQWKAKGGIGILHKSASDTIKQLEKLGFKNSNVNEIQIQGTPFGMQVEKYYRLWDKNEEILVDKIQFIKTNQGFAVKLKYAGSVHTLLLDNKLKSLIGRAEPLNLNEIQIGHGYGFIVPSSIKGGTFKVDYNKILKWVESTNRKINKHDLENLVSFWITKQITHRLQPNEIPKYDDLLFKFLSVVVKHRINEIQIEPSKPVTFKMTRDYSSDIKMGTVSIKGSNVEEEMVMLKNNVLLIDFEINHSDDEDEQEDADQLDDFTDALDQAKVKYVTKRSGGRRISYYQIQIPSQYINIVKSNINEIQIQSSKPISFKPDKDGIYGSFKIKGENQWWYGSLEDNKTSLDIEFDIDGGDEADRGDLENEATLFATLLKQRGIKYKYQKDRDYRIYTIPMTYVNIVDKLDEIEIRPKPLNNLHQEWLKFYKDNIKTIEDSGFKSLDDVENAIEEIKEKMANALKLNLNKKHKGSFPWSEYELDDKIYWEADRRFEFKYGMDDAEFKYFFRGLKKYANKAELDEVQIRQSPPNESMNIIKNFFENENENSAEARVKDFNVETFAGFPEEQQEEEEGVAISVKGNKPTNEYSDEEKASLLKLLRDAEEKLVYIHTFIDLDLDELEFMSWDSETHHPILFWIHPNKDNYKQQVTTLFQLLNNYKVQSKVNEIQISQDRLIVGNYYGFEWAGWKPWKLVQISPNKDLRKYIYRFEDKNQQYQPYQTITKFDLDAIVFPRKLIKQINNER